MAKFAHTITYKLDGHGPTREMVLHAEDKSAAEELFLEIVPTGRIEKVLTTVPSKS